MEQPFEMIHTGENEPRFNMPYTPAVKVHSGKMVFLAGVTAAPVYHSHPHIAAEFDDIPLDPGDQAAMAIEAIRQVLVAAGGGLEHVVEMTRYIVDIADNQDAINRVLGQAFGDHRPASTTVEVVRLATDPRLVLELRVVAAVPE
jgi:enamine deaminase RidA (YjgF/YER057c/UK114 family)